MEIETAGIVIGSGTAGILIKGLVDIWRARNQKTEITPNPLSCTVEQSAFQAHCKDNAKDHTDIFDRLRRVEADVAGHTAAILAIKDTQNRIYDMVTKLYDKICGGKRK